jgi:hypothetical protein
VRALVQRVSRASVTVDGEVVGAIGPGLCVFVGVTHTDGPAEAAELARKLWHLRIFPDDEDRMDRPWPTWVARCWWSASSPSTAARRGVGARRGWPPPAPTTPSR